jgi:imidazolonepropionase-like amidohydrolase
MRQNHAMRVGFLLMGVAASASSQSPTSDIVLVGVTVIDVVAGRRVPDQTVIIHASHISAMGPRALTAVPRGAREVDGRGKYLIPGLWDMHGHVHQHSHRPGTDEHALQFPLYIANGVTGVRDMWTNLEDFVQIRGWNDARASGELIAPRIIGTGPMVDGPNGVLQHTVVVRSTEDARRVVDSLTDGGAAAIKIHSAVPREAYFAIATRATERGIPLIGHVPAAVTTLEAARAGQRSIEHGGGLGDGCASAQVEDEVTRLRVDRSRRPPPGKLQQMALDGYDERRCAALIAEFARLGAWYVPTLVMDVARLMLSDTLSTTRPELRHIPASELDAWQTSRDTQRERITPELAETRRRTFSQQLHFIAAMQHAGVPLLAGTDVTNDWIVPGFSVHDELALFVAAGLTPAEALRTATIAPARYAGMADSVGAVGAAKVADLVLLDADPLAAISNTRKIRAVFVNGRYFDRPRLDSLLASVTPERIGTNDNHNSAGRRVSHRSVLCRGAGCRGSWRFDAASARGPLVPPG